MQRTSLVVGALLFQAAVVSVMLVKAVMPLWTGQEVLIMAHAVDPLDIMRGDHVALDYDISRINTREVRTDLQLSERIRYGDDLYVTLDRNDSGVVATGIYRSKPEGHLFLHGRAANPVTMPASRDTIRARTAYVNMTYGIEEYYTDTELAQSIERNLRSGKGLPVYVMVDDQGNARIRSVGDHDH